MAENYADRIEQCALADAGAVRLANATTGAGDTNVPDAIASLIAGYGGGGLTPVWSGDVVLTKYASNLEVPYVSSNRNVMIRFDNSGTANTNTNCVTTGVFIVVAIPSSAGQFHGFSIYGGANKKDAFLIGSSSGFTENATNTSANYKANFNANGIQFGTYQSVGVEGETLSVKVYDISGIVNSI